MDLGFLKGGYSKTTTHGNAHLYSITLGESASYSANIGAISDHAEYAAWIYNWGLYVHNYEAQDGRFFQILDFWTTALGTSY